MSHNFPYRRFPPQTETPQPDYDARRAVGGESDFYGQPQPTPSSAHEQSSSSSAEPPNAAQDVALGLLRSYGLDPTDLARLAELPEEMLNLDSLPHLLRQFKERRETTSACPPSSSATAPLSSRRPGLSRPPDAPSSPAVKDKWAQIRNQPVQYPLEHVLSAAKSHSFEQLSSDWPDHRANPRPSPAAGSYKHPSSTETPLPPLSSSSCYMVDYGHQERTADQGKQGRDDRYERPAHGQPASGRMPPPRYSQSDSAGNYGSGLPRDPHRASHRAQPWAEQQPDPLPHSRAGAGQAVAAPTAPSRKEALDFHGSPPGAFPYSCSLCGITALSAKVWLQHINGSQHADKQLALLQRYPAWDCRMGRKSRFNNQPATPKEKERPAPRPQTTNQNSGLQRNKKTGKKTGGGNSKVVCAKFEAQSVDEARLRTLTEPFGKIVKVLMFPCLAFVEMGSSDQAKDLEKYYSSNPAAVQGKEVTFQISSTFSFLQSSRVLSFTPAPQGEDGFSDLLAIVKRFGAPLYTLALPSLAFIEMKMEADAQKLVNYYSTNNLKINGEVVTVGFSGQYNTLMRVSSAKKYEEQEEGGGGGGGGGGGSSVTKRSRSPSPRKGRSQGDDENPPKRSRRDGAKEERRSGSRRRSRSPSRERRQGSGRRSRSSDSRSRCEEAVVDAATPPAQPGPKAEAEIAAGSDPETKEAGPTQDGPTQDPAESSDEESDIEGMAVIGEDGESLDDEEEEEEEEEEKSAVNDVRVKEEPKEEEVVSGPQPKTLKKDEEEEEEPNFMAFLENCITLDELGEEEEEKECDDEDEQEEGEPQVIRFRDLPSPRCTDAASEKEAHDRTTSDPAESLPQPAGAEETSRVGLRTEEDSASSGKHSSEEREVDVAHKEEETPPQEVDVAHEEEETPPQEVDVAHEEEEETPPQEADGLEEGASEPESKDEEKPEEATPCPGGHTQRSDQAAAERSVQRQPGCGGGSVEPQPTKPIGVEFVRPVVGYFCHLCEVVYVDEDEAKTQHCSSLTHYQKYKERTGRDPWSS